MRRLLLLAFLLSGCATTGAPGSDPIAADPSSAAGTPVSAVPSWVRDAPQGPWPAVVINEVLPGNDSILTDEANQYDDWIELYNGTASTVNLSGWSLAQGKNPDWTFPKGTKIGPHAHLLVWADDEPEQGKLHATLRLSGLGESLSLVAPDGAVVDTLTWPALKHDVVYGRFPSGGTNRAASIVATPWNENPVDPGLSTDPSDALFPKDHAIRVDLYLDQHQEQILRNHDHAYVQAAIAYEGAFFYPVELHIKGGLGSHRSIDEKAAFRVGLDAFLPGTRLRGQEHLTLNNMVQDPSTVHEMLAYSLFRDSGVPAPRTGYVELWLNGEYRGLYLNVETVDDQFLQRWYPDDSDGNLYEGAYGDDVTASEIDALDLDEQGALDVTDRSDLAELAAVLDGPHDEAHMDDYERLVDLDEFLPAIAGEVVLGHWDGYFYSANNYRIYHRPSVDQWSLVPSGTDQTLSSQRGIYDVTGAIARFCLDVPSCRTRYQLALWDQSDRLLALGCDAKVSRVLPFTSPLYDADPYKESDMDTLRTSVQETLDWCDTMPGDIIGYLP